MWMKEKYGRYEWYCTLSRTLSTGFCLAGVTGGGDATGRNSLKPQLSPGIKYVY